jgi:hypothetical protein
LYHTRKKGNIRSVTGHAEAPPVFALDLTDSAIYQFLIQIVEYYRSAPAAQLPADLPADANTGSRDYRDVIFKG